MIPAPFQYAKAASLDQARTLLAENEDAKLLAGGHSLLPMMKLRLAAPAMLIDIGRLDELSYVRTDGDEIAVGALTLHCEIMASPVLHAEVPLLPYVASQVGDRQVRARGTIGGSLAHADPSADLPTAVCALGGTLVALGPSGRREIPVADFFTGYFETALAPDEILVEIRVPRTGSAPWGYQKFVRRANDWAIVAAATVAGRVALANMGPTPIRAAATEAALAAGEPVDAAARLADEGTQPTEDMHADREYRRHLARLLTRRALEQAG